MRGIATGTTFRRLVAKTLARQFSKVVEATCSPFQFALIDTGRRRLWDTQSGSLPTWTQS